MASRHGDSRTASREHNGARLRLRRPRLSLAVIPTLFTLGNLVSGFAAIWYAAKPMDERFGPGWSGLTMAGALVFLGLMLDAVDGAIARLTQSTSDLGTQLDSLADVVTFGAAPAFMTLMLVKPYLTAEYGVNVLGPEADNVLGRVIWGAAAVYVSCAALRLARYNVEVGGISDRGSFRGLPSPGAAGGVASLVILHQHLLVAKYLPDDVTPAFAKAAALGIPFIVLLCAFAMVSSLPYMHFANRFVHGPKSFAYVARIAIALALAIWWFQETVALIFTAYLLSAPLAALWRGARPGRGAPHPPQADGDDALDAEDD
jgi:CDP-diacylglycerol--serine O-phosphatidyltransferase